MKTKWTKIEIDALNVENRFSTLKNAMEKGFFSFTTLQYNKLLKDREEAEQLEKGYCYSGASNAYIQVYKHKEAENLYKNKKLSFK